MKLSVWEISTWKHIYKVLVIWEVQLKTTLGTTAYLAERLKTSNNNKKVRQYKMWTETGKDLKTLNSISYSFGHNEK